MKRERIEKILMNSQREELSQATMLRRELPEVKKKTDTSEFLQIWRLQWPREEGN